MPITPLKNMPAMGGTVISRVERIRPKPSCWVAACITPAVGVSMPMVSAMILVTNRVLAMVSTKSALMSAITASKMLEKMVASP